METVAITFDTVQGKSGPLLQRTITKHVTQIETYSLEDLVSARLIYATNSEAVLADFDQKIAECKKRGLDQPILIEVDKVNDPA